MLEFSYNRRTLTLYFWLGLIGGICFFLTLPLLYLGTPVFSLPLILPLPLYLILKRQIPLRVFEDRFELKIAPLRPVEILRKTEIRRILRQEKKMEIHLDDGRALIVPLAIFSAEDRERVTALLKGEES